MNVDEYLKRIGCLHLKGSQPNLANLTTLQKSHLLQFPFDNLDMHMDKPKKWSLEEAYDLMVHKSRGGCCIQLNGTFGWLLIQLGYDVTYYPVYVYNQFLKTYYRLPIHCVLFVKLADDYYYTDVGTVRMINTPVQVVLDGNRVQKQLLGTYKFTVDPDDAKYALMYRSRNCLDENNYEWVPQMRYVPSEPVHDFDFFKAMNEYVQTPEHPVNFYRTLLVKHVANDKMLYLIGSKFSIIVFSEAGEKRVDRVIDDLAELRRLVKEEFKICIDYEKYVPKDNYNMEMELARHKILENKYN